MGQSKTLTQASFDVLVREHLVPVFKRYGFKKSALNWYIRRDEQPGGWGIINLQKSAFGNRNHITFTFNLAVMHDREPEHAAKRRSHACAEQQDRIGSLLPRSRYSWWDLEQPKRGGKALPAQVLKIAEEVCPLLERKAIPWVLTRLAGPPVVG
jgi:hypothetical protein